MTTLDNSKKDIPIPPSIYFGGCAFGAAFCKLFKFIRMNFHFTRRIYL